MATVFDATCTFLTIVFVPLGIIVQGLICVFLLIIGVLFDERRSARQAYVAGDTSDTEESQQEASVTIAEVTVPDDSDDGDATRAGAETRNNGNPPREPLIVFLLKYARPMRAVLSEFVAHHLCSYMDVLVSVQLLVENDADRNNVLAYNTAIGICQIIWFARIFSALILTAKELAPRIRSVGSRRKSFRRYRFRIAVLTVFLPQILDLRITSMIDKSRKKVTCQSKNEPIKCESNLNFRYIRTLQAMLQSVPSALLLLRYMLITGHSDTILIVSIACSIWSITDSTLNEDNAWMIGSEWETHKRRLPPSWNFVKHALCRMSEVTYRIALLALIWTVCGDAVFASAVLMELLFSGARSAAVFAASDNTVIDSVVRAFRSLAIVPSEEMYYPHWKVSFDSERWEDHIGRVGGGGHNAVITALYTIVHVAAVWLTCGCCAIAMIPMFCKAWCCRGRFCREKLLRKEIGWAPLLRMSVSFWEFTMLIVYGVLADEDENGGLLFTERGIRLLIAAIICYLFNSQYLAMCPPFALPFGIGCRSRWGFAYAGELAELKRLRVPCANQSEYWDAPCDALGYSAAVFAMAKGHSEIVAWLERCGATAHKSFTAQQAAQLMRKERKRIQRHFFESYPYTNVAGGSYVEGDVEVYD